MVRGLLERAQAVPGRRLPRLAAGADARKAAATSSALHNTTTPAQRETAAAAAARLPARPARTRRTAMTRTSAMWVVWRLAACTTLIVLAFAMAAPVLAVSLQQAGYSTAVVGAFAMIPFVMIGVLIPVMPTVLARWGMVRAYQWGSLLQLGGALGYAAGDGLGVWSAASVASGMGAAALWNATEALLAREAPAERRGRVMGLYQTSLGRGPGARSVRAGFAGLGRAACAVGCRRAGGGVLRDRAGHPSTRDERAAAPRAKRDLARPARGAGAGRHSVHRRCVRGGAGLGQRGLCVRHGPGFERRRQRGRRHRGGQLPVPVPGRRRGRQVQGDQRVFIGGAAAAGRQPGVRRGRPRTLAAVGGGPGLGRRGRRALHARR